MTAYITHDLAISTKEVESDDDSIDELPVKSIDIPVDDDVTLDKPEVNDEKMLTFYRKVLCPLLVELGSANYKYS